MRAALPVLVRALHGAAAPGSWPATTDATLLQHYRALFAPKRAWTYSAGVGDTWPQPAATVALSADLFEVPVERPVRQRVIPC